MYSESRMDLLSILEKWKVTWLEHSISCSGIKISTMQQQEVKSSYHTDEWDGFDFLVCVFCVWEEWAGGGELPLYNALRAPGPRQSWARRTSPDPDALPAPAAWSSLKHKETEAQLFHECAADDASRHSRSGHYRRTFGFEKRRFLKGRALLLSPLDQTSPPHLIRWKNHHRSSPVTMETQHLVSPGRLINVGLEDESEKVRACTFDWSCDFC